MNRSDLATRIDELAETPSADALPSDAEGVVEELLNALESGEVRAAERGENGQWAAVPWVKRGILLGFRVGEPRKYRDGSLPFIDKHTFPVRTFGKKHGVRIVPGGSSVRRGAYLAPGVAFSGGTLSAVGPARSAARRHSPAVRRPRRAAGCMCERSKIPARRPGS